MTFAARSLLVVSLLLLSNTLSAATWVQTNLPLWGLRNGLRFALRPAGFGGRDGGPRGLIRLGAPVRPQGGYALVNFIAIEPVVKGKRGFSELEWSSLDASNGKRLSAGAPTYSSPQPGVEQIEVPVNVEAFANGARVRLLLSQRSDAPDELRLTLHSQAGSARMDCCILTATMGNMVRTRLLWLKDETLSSLKLNPDHRGTGFAPHTVRPLDRLVRNAVGDVIVAITGNEANPSAVFPFPGRQLWHYPGVPVMQYWKMPKTDVVADLCVAVNARATYWQSQTAIPGGVAFENFELRAPFREGQTFVFGITCQSPSDLGLTNRPQKKVSVQVNRE